MPVQVYSGWKRSMVARIFANFLCKSLLAAATLSLIFTCVYLRRELQPITSSLHLIDQRPVWTQFGPESTDIVAEETNGFRREREQEISAIPLPKNVPENYNIDKSILQVRPIKVNINQSDVIVVIHIQKTGGSTFEEHLVRDIRPPCRENLPKPAPHRPAFDCYNAAGQLWMFNRYSVRWPCGLHADYTEMMECVDPWFRNVEEGNRTRNYHYVTVLRDPETRFLSEWMHVRRGATWHGCRLWCDGRGATLEEVPRCYKEENWRGVDLDEFLQCKSNLGFNRQTRMLANLSLSDCYRLKSKMSPEIREQVMLESAKHTLATLAYFGLMEYQVESAALFQAKFRGLSFREGAFHYHGTQGGAYEMTEAQMKKVRDGNRLDAELYKFGRYVFMQRLKAAGIPFS